MLANAHAVRVEEETYAQFGHVCFNFEPFVPDVDFPGLVYCSDTTMIVEDNVCTTRTTLGVGIAQASLKISLANAENPVPVETMTDAVRARNVNANSEEKQHFFSTSDWTATTLRRNNLTTWTILYAEHQTNVLNVHFSRNNEPTPTEKTHIAFEVDMTVEQVSSWFYDKRKEVVAEQSRFKTQR